MPGPSKPPVEVPPAQLLQYLPKYRLLVCSLCQYAVRSNAVARHLKEIHRIQRGNRRPYMQYASKFDLAEPDEVLKVQVHDFPVPLLPVQDGFICRHDTCMYLCASVKRMTSHWTSAHGRPGRETVDWQPARLQTFFQGNLLSYFTEPGLACRTNPSEHTATKTSPLHVAPPQQDTILLSRESAHIVALTERDKSLLQHYIESTSLTLAINEETKIVWQAVVPQLAQTHEFLMHAILACAALHQNRLRKSKYNHRELMLYAITHHDLAFPLFRAAIENASKQNAEAIFVFSHLLVIYSFAMEHEDERLLLVRNNEQDNIPRWLYFLRNGCIMLCDLWDWLRETPVSALVQIWEFPMEPGSQEIQAARTEYLLSLIPSDAPPLGEDSWSEDVTTFYRDAAASLAQAFACMDTLSQTFTMWDVLRMWPLAMEEGFIKLLSDGHPAALILLAHYCVLLRKIESTWYFQGRAASLLANIELQLDRRWHASIRWPLEEIAGSGVQPRDIVHE